jgi:hypothetical protein
MKKIDIKNIIIFFLVCQIIYFENTSENLSCGCTGISSAIGSSGLAQAPIILFGNEEQKKNIWVV